MAGRIHGILQSDSAARRLGPQTSDHPHMKIVINAPTVSGDHARLSVVDSTLYCEDLVRRVQRRTEGRRAAPSL